MLDQRGRTRLAVATPLKVVVTILAALFMGFLLHFVYHEPDPLYPIPVDQSRWRLYGKTIICPDDDCYGPNDNHTPSERETGEQALFLEEYPGGEDVKELIRGLYALQVSCSDQLQLEVKYAKFLEALAAYTAFHRQERRGETAKRLIWVCDVRRWCGGLADRVKGITYALLLAMLSRRVLLLDWRHSKFGEQSFLQSNMIEWQLTQEERDKLYSQDMYKHSVGYNNKRNCPTATLPTSTSSAKRVAALEWTSTRTPSDSALRRSTESGSGYYWPLTCYQVLS